MIVSSNGSGAGRRGVSIRRRRLAFALCLLGYVTLAGPAFAYAPNLAVEGRSLPIVMPANSTAARMAQAQPSPTPSPTPQPARPAASPSPAPSPASPASAQAPPGEPIGNVATLTGTATVIRNKNSLPLKLKDDVYLNDVLVTSANSTLGITFNDATTFNLTANARITVDNYIYEDGGKQNSALFDITKGTVAFVAAAVAKSGDMKISTPSATLGIRGTTGLVEVDGTTAGAHNIKLYPDPDGRVGHIDVSDRNGVRLGSLTQASSGFTVRSGAGGRVTATPLAISPQQAARDQGIVRQVHAAQVVGRQVVTEQRALRQSRTPGQPGQQRQNNLQQNRPGPNQPGAPNRSGQQGQPSNRPGQPGQPSGPKQGQQPSQKPGQQQNQQQSPAPNRAGQQGQRPSGGQQGQQHPPAAEQHNAPGAHQQGLQNRPSTPPKRPPPAPKGKKEKKR
jgi:FecR protein